MRHPEVAPDVLVGVGALLLADDDDPPAADPGEPGDDRLRRRRTAGRRGARRTRRPWRRAARGSAAGGGCAPAGRGPRRLRGRGRLVRGRSACRRARPGRRSTTAAPRGSAVRRPVLVGGCRAVGRPSGATSGASGGRTAPAGLAAHGGGPAQPAGAEPLPFVGRRLGLVGMTRSARSTGTTAAGTTAGRAARVAARLVALTAGDAGSASSAGDLGAELATGGRPGRGSRARTGTRERWKPGGSSWAIVPAETRAPAKPMRAFGSARLTSPRTANEAKTPPVVGSVRTLMNGHAGRAQPLERARRSWRAASARACPPASAPRPTRRRRSSGTRSASACSAARVTFSPTTAPIEPPMNPKSMTQIATGRPSIVPVPQTAASRMPGRELGGRDPVGVRSSGRRSRADRRTGGPRRARRTCRGRGAARAARRPTAGSGGRTIGQTRWTLSSCLLNSISPHDGHFVQRSGG